MKMNPAEYVIHIFGGVRPTARALRRDASGVCRWTKARSRGGRGGNVPSLLQREILALAEKKGLDITPTDLIYGRQVKK